MSTALQQFEFSGPDSGSAVQTGGLKRIGPARQPRTTSVLLSSFAVHLFVVANVAAISILKLTAEPQIGGEASFVAYFWPVIVGAYVGGFRASLTAVLVSLLAINYHFQPPHFELNLAGSSGTLLALFSVEGILIGWIVSALRAANARAREATLAQRRSQELLVSFLENTPAAAMIRDDGGRVVYANRRTEERYGWNPAGWRNRTISELFESETAAELHAAEKSVFSAGESVELLRVFNAAGADEFWLEHIFPVLNGSGRRFIAGISLNVTDRERALAALMQHKDTLDALNKELATARDQAETASRTKSAFLANMSHELRTPLNAIIGYAEMLEEDLAGPGHENTRCDLRRIRAAGFHLLRIIDDVLDLSRIEAGRLDLTICDFDLAEEIEETVGAVMPLAERNQNNIHICLARDIGVVHSDPGKIRQALCNLLSNACKCTHNGDIYLRACLEQNRDFPVTAGPDRGGIIVITVSDNGVGIESAHLESVFSEFSQEEPSCTRRHGGAGPGLAISRRYVRMLGGDLKVQSELGKGSTFHMRFPAYAVIPQCHPQQN